MRGAIAWLVVLPWAAWALVRVLGIERGYPFVQLIAFNRPDVLAVQGSRPRSRQGSSGRGSATCSHTSRSTPPRTASSGLYSRLELDALPPFYGANWDMQAAAFNIAGAPPLRIIS